MHNHDRIIISNIAPIGSVCEICGKPAPWQMYCQDCGFILRFYCNDHAYLSQGTHQLEKKVKKAYLNKVHVKIEEQINKAQEEWQLYLNNLP